VDWYTKPNCLEDTGLTRSSSDKAALLSRIKDEFWLKTPPSLPEGWENLTDDSKSRNYWEGIEETKPFWGKDWSELKLEDYQMCRCVFTFLPKENLPYFIGGYLTISLLGNQGDYGFVEMFDLIDPREQRPKTAKRTWAYNREKIEPLNAGQRMVIAEYLQFLETNSLAADTSFMRGVMLGEVRE
jgi:hypothetical protein